MELNGILSPGGVFVWSATPVYHADTRDRSVWKAMVALTESICWKVVAKTVDSSGIGLVIYQKPVSNLCYEEWKENDPLCVIKQRSKIVHEAGVYALQLVFTNSQLLAIGLPPGLKGFAVDLLVYRWNQVLKKYLRGH